jgi:hypothetical protein
MFLRAILQLLSFQLLFIRHALSVKPIEVRGSEFINSASKDRFHVVGVESVDHPRGRERGNRCG